MSSGAFACEPLCNYGERPRITINTVTSEGSLPPSSKAIRTRTRKQNGTPVSDGGYKLQGRLNFHTVHRLGCEFRKEIN